MSVFYTCGKWIHWWCSEFNPGKVLGTLCGARDQILVSSIGKYPPHCIIVLYFLDYIFITENGEITGSLNFIQILREAFLSALKLHR